jgi:hypothetical protein
MALPWSGQPLLAAGRARRGDDYGQFRAPLPPKPFTETIGPLDPSVFGGDTAMIGGYADPSTDTIRLAPGPDVRARSATSSGTCSTRRCSAAAIG